MANPDERSITISPILILLDVVGYDAADIQRRVFDRNIASGKILFSGVSDVVVESPTRLVVTVADGFTAWRVRNNIMERVHAIMLQDSPGKSEFNIRSASGLTISLVD